MRKMKSTGIPWIGMIPDSWKICRLRFLCDILTGNQDTQDNDPDGEYPFYVRSPIVEKSNKYTFEGDAILMAGDGVGAGKVFHFVSGKYGCHQRVYSLQKIKGIERRFLYYYLLNRFYVSIETANSKSTVDSVRLNMLQDFPIMIPEEHEQTRIAAFLDTECAHIDAVIEKTRASIEEYKKLKQAMITQAVTKGIRPGRKMKDSGIEWIGESPEEWEYRKLKTFIDIPVIDGPHESPELFDSGVPYISATAIENGKINFDLMRGYISEEYCLECDKRYKPKRDDILLVKLGASTGQVAIIDTDLRFNIWVPLAAIRCNSSAYSKFIYYAFQSNYLIRQMELSWTFGTQQTLGVKTIEQLYFLLPIYNEQTQIVAYLDAKCAEIDTLIAKKQQLLTELEFYKKSLIFEYVTGKKEVLG